MRQPIGIAGALGIAALALSLGPSPAEAQNCGDAWNRPVVCEVRVGVANPGDPIQELLSGEPIEIAAGGRVNLEVQSVDQFGRQFPDDRLLPQLEADRSCSDLVSIEQASDNQFSVEAESRRGSCRLWLWIPGNLNLEWQVAVDVVSATADGYSRAQAEALVSRLYRGVLGRDAEPQGLQSQTAEVLRGRLENVVRGMVQSREFVTERSSLSPQDLLEDLYGELLGRELDAEGIRAHLGDMEQRRTVEVALRILDSEEFERSLLQEVGR